MAIAIVKVPDTGGANKVDVIEVCVAVGDTLTAEQSVVVLETDKASMEIPADVDGKVIAVKVKEGDQVSFGDVLIEVEVADSVAPTVQVAAPAAPRVTADVPAPAPMPTSVSVEISSTPINISIPDLGGAAGVDVIEVCVAVGDQVREGDSLIVLETDKASMEIPAPASGTVLSLTVKEGGKVSAGDVVGTIAGVVSATEANKPTQADTVVQPAVVAVADVPISVAAAPSATVPAASATIAAATNDGSGHSVYAGPAVRKLARQLGVPMQKVQASGTRGRLSKDDIRAYVKQLIVDVESGKLASGVGIPAVPEVDFAQFGEIALEKMSKIKKLTAASMTRSWLNVPHVTQFDDADITAMEEFRKSMKAEADKRGVKLTPLPFLMKAVASALAAEPSFNVSLHADGEHIVRKQYIHVGMAVDTPAGLVVPVIRDVDKKGLWQLAQECAELAAKARDGKLKPQDMQGGCFTISSLGSTGGTGFTPIINTPEAAIMGVSKAAMKPVWNGAEFVPRLMLPLAISYDHRAINGGDCGRFFTYLVDVIGDIRRLLL